MKKVLIITYYWPPSGGAGVQRWLKFAKYLPEFGWQPIIYTPENPDFSLKDESLQKDIPKEAIVLKTKIWEPYGIYKKLLGKGSDSANAGFFAGGKKSWKQRLSIFIRGNFFIPDPRVFWVKPSVKYLKKYLQEHPVDTIISTGPPHSMHLIALGLKKYFPEIKWVADFRDPWTDIDFYQDLNLTKWADKKHHKLEKEVVLKADEVITVSNHMAYNFENIRKKPTQVIHNGYDSEDFKSIIRRESKANTFEIVYVGSMNKDRNYDAFWQAISKVSGVQVRLIGKIDTLVRESICRYKLQNRVKVVDYLPHAEVLDISAQADVLYLPINDVPSAKGILTGKIYEYLALKTPILCIGPKDGDAAEIIKETNSGEVFEANETDAMVKWLLNNDRSKYTFSHVEQFSRRALTRKLVDHL